MLAPKSVLGPVMRSFDMQLKMPRVVGKSMKAGLVASNGVDDWDEGLDSGDMSAVS
jgi:hypothetical protein